MSDGQIVVEMSVKEAKAFFALQAIERQQTKVEEGLSEITREAKKVDVELARFAERAKKIDATPAEKYAAAVQKIQAAHQAGHLSLEMMERALQREQTALEKGEEKIRAHEDSLRALADRIKELDSTPAERYAAAVDEIKRTHEAGMISAEQMALAIQRETVALEQANLAIRRTGGDLRYMTEEQREAVRQAKAIEESQKSARQELARFAESVKKIDVTPAEKYAATVARIHEAQKAGLLTTQESERAVRRESQAYQELASAEAKAVEKARDLAEQQRRQGSIGGMIKGQLTAMAAGYMTASTAVQVFNSTIEFGRKQTQEAIDESERLLQVRIELARISANPEVARVRADAAATKYGIDRKESLELFANAEAMGFGDRFEEVAKARYVFKDLNAVGMVAGKPAQIFKRDPLEMLNMAIAAEAGPVSFEELARAVPTAAEGATIAKSSAEETMAVLSVMAERFGSTQTAADRVKGFSTKVGLSPTLGGQGIMAAFSDLQKMSPEDRSKFLGTDQEINATYNALTETAAKISERQKIITAAGASTFTGNSLLEQRTAMAMQDPGIKNIQTSKAAESTKLAAGEDLLSRGGSDAKAAVLLNDARNLQKGRNVARRYISYGFAEATAGMTIDGTATNTAGMVGDVIGTNFLGISGLLATALDAIRELSGAAKDLQKVANKTPANRAAQAEAAVPQN